MAQMYNRYDNMLFEILQSEGQLLPFLDVIFSFLYRRTDFYKVQTEKNNKFGFPEGVAETILQKVFYKFREKAKEDEELSRLKKLEQLAIESDVPEPASSDVEVSSVNDGEVTDEITISPVTDDDNERKKLTAVPKNNAVKKNVKEKPRDDYCFNGAVRDNYSWSQTNTEVDAYIKVSEKLTSAKSLSVKITSSHLIVSVREQQESEAVTWNTLVDADFPYKVNMDGTMWTLVPGDHVHVCLEKRDERYWECLLEGEEKLDVSKLDTSKPMHDLDQESQSVIEELLYNQKQKEEGKPTTQDKKVHDILKDAWDLEGSPFQGRPYDPSHLNITTSGNYSRNQ